MPSPRKPVLGAQQRGRGRPSASKSSQHDVVQFLQALSKAMSATRQPGGCGGGEAGRVAPVGRKLPAEQAAKLQQAGSVSEQAAWEPSKRQQALELLMALSGGTAGVARATVPSALRNLLPPAGRVVRDAGITAGMLSPAIASQLGHSIPSFGNNVVNSADQKALIRLMSDRAAGRGRTRGQR
jgi:hypothetical protein